MGNVGSIWIGIVISQLSIICTLWFAAGIIVEAISANHATIQAELCKLNRPIIWSMVFNPVGEELPAVVTVKL